MRNVPLIVFVALGFSTTGVFGQGYPDSVKTIRYRTTADNSRQRALFWTPETTEPVPLLVALHSWSNDYRQGADSLGYFNWCQKQGWAFIHPNFRGTNNTPQAMGSDLAVADIASSVEYAKSVAKIDSKRIYCVGVSGGGHAAMLMAARHPDIWAGVSAWCGISDIAQWHRDCAGEPATSKYAKNIEKSLGGSPDSSAKRLADAANRSPITWLKKISFEKLPPLDINHGIHDGRRGSVPFVHSLHAWNAAVKDPVLSEAFIDSFYATQLVPDDRKQPQSEIHDELYDERGPIFRMRKGNARVTIFQGGHEIVHTAALTWLAAQRKGAPANWQPKRIRSSHSR